MQQQLSTVNSGSWLFSPSFKPFYSQNISSALMGNSIVALVIFLVLAFAGFVIYKVVKKNDVEVSDGAYEEAMANEFCPSLLAEVTQLRTEVEKLRSAL